MSKRAIGWLYFPYLLTNLICLFLLTNYFQVYSSHVQVVTNDQSKLQSDQSTYGLQSTQASDDQYTLTIDQQLLSQEQYYWVRNLEIVTGVMVVVSILGLIAWINTLINLSRGREWVWFVLTFFFGIMIVIYLIGGPAVPPKKSLATQMPASPPENSLPGVSFQPEAVRLRPSSFPTDQQLGSQVSQPHPSALEVLQLRLAHGEIDEQTYQRLRDALRS